METSSAAKANAVLQRITGPFTVLVPSSHFPPQSQDTKLTVQTAEHHSYGQSTVEPGHPGKTRTHNSLSLTSSVLPGTVTTRAKKSLIVQPPFQAARSPTRITA